MTAGLRITLDDREVQRAVKGMRRWLQRDIEETLDRIGARLELTTRHRFETETAPSGEPWKPSHRAIEESGQTLTDTGRLRASITRFVRRDEVQVGTNVVYAAIHQFGGKTPPRTIRPRRKKALFWPGAAHPVASVRHPGSNVPARPFLGLSSRDRDAIVRIVRERARRAS